MMPWPVGKKESFADRLQGAVFCFDNMVKWKLTIDIKEMTSYACLAAGNAKNINEKKYSHFTSIY